VFNISKNTEKIKVNKRVKRRKKKREVIGIYHCRCGNWFTNEKNKIIGVFLYQHDVSCKACKSPIKNTIYAGRHGHPKELKRAVRLITKYYIEDHPGEVID